MRSVMEAICDKYIGVPNMTATKFPNWDQYDWDAMFTVDTDMTETRNPPLTQIWLRRRKKLFLNFDFTQLRLRQDQK